MNKVIQLNTKRKLTTRQKIGTVVIGTIEAVENSKHKVDDYFGVESKEDQFWFYGIYSVMIGFPTLSMIIS